MNCKQACEQLSEYIDGELDEQSRRAIEGHLAGCEACRDELEDLRKTIAAVKSLPTVPAPEELSSRILAGIPERAKVRPLRLRMFRALAAAAVVVLAFGIVRQVRQIPMRDDAPPPAAPAPADLAVRDAEKAGKAEAPERSLAEATKPDQKPIPLKADAPTLTEAEGAAARRPETAKTKTPAARTKAMKKEAAPPMEAEKGPADKDAGVKQLDKPKRKAIPPKKGSENLKTLDALSARAGAARPAKPTAPAGRQSLGELAPGAPAPAKEAREAAPPMIRLTAAQLTEAADAVKRILAAGNAKSQVSVTDNEVRFDVELPASAVSAIVKALGDVPGVKLAGDVPAPAERPRRRGARRENGAETVRLRILLQSTAAPANKGTE